MPATLSRPCPRCQRELPTPSAFRDLGVTGPGRPPVVCRECREKSPELLAQHAANIARRPAARELLRERSARTAEQLAADAELFHPDGSKLCPPRAGCGQELPLDHFGSDRTQHDGLEGVCRSCKADHRALLSLKD